MVVAFVSPFVDAELPAPARLAMPAFFSNTFQNLSDSSAAAVASIWPSGLKAECRTRDSWAGISMFFPSRNSESRPHPPDLGPAETNRQRRKPPPPPPRRTRVQTLSLARGVQFRGAGSDSLLRRHGQDPRLLLLLLPMEQQHHQHNQ